MCIGKEAAAAASRESMPAAPIHGATGKPVLLETFPETKEAEPVNHNQLLKKPSSCIPRTLPVVGSTFRL